MAEPWWLTSPFIADMHLYIKGKVKILKNTNLRHFSWRYCNVYWELYCLLPFWGTCLNPYMAPGWWAGPGILWGRSSAPWKAWEALTPLSTTTESFPPGARRGTLETQTDTHACFHHFTEHYVNLHYSDLMDFLETLPNCRNILLNLNLNPSL